MRGKAQVAILLDYESRWATRVLPQGRSYSASAVALDWYSTAARLGVDVDFIGQHSDLDGYKLILAPDLVIAEEAFVERLARADAKVVFGARSGSKTRDMHIPEGLPPDRWRSSSMSASRGSSRCRSFTAKPFSMATRPTRRAVGARPSGRTRPFSQASTGSIVTARRRSSATTRHATWRLRPTAHCSTR